MYRDAHKRTKNLLTAHREEVEKVAQLLLAREVITREDMIGLLGKRPFPGRADDMDRWLDKHGKTVAPPPLETPPVTSPSPTPATAPAQ
jgi:AFG3 family protein